MLLTSSIVLVTSYVFVLSCAYVWGLDSVLPFTITNYLDYRDYVQCLPEKQTYLSVICLVAFGLLGLVGLEIQYFTTLFSRKLWKIVWWLVPLALFFPIVYLFITAFSSSFNIAAALKDDLPKMAISKVFRKGEPPIEGVLFLHSSRYIFLWRHDNVVAVPNGEVQMIQTGWSLPPATNRITTKSPSPSAMASLGPTGAPPSSVSPERTATPSPTSSTPK